MADKLTVAWNISRYDRENKSLGKNSGKNWTLLSKLSLTDNNNYQYKYTGDYTKSRALIGSLSRIISR